MALKAGAWPVERQKTKPTYYRRGRSKYHDGGDCSFAFNGSDLRDVGRLDMTTETRGDSCHGTPAYRVGDLARLVLGARFK
jgi:hypothetical protein